MANWYLGTMGFGYKDWVSVFYPEGCRTPSYLPYYSRSFNSVELDTTFYGVPNRKKITQWAASVPESFVFSAKIPKKITHEMGLKNTQAELYEFIDAIRSLENKLGVLLIQLLPGFTAVEERVLGAFLELLPEDVRFAVEFRHPSWERQKTEDLLRAFKVCWATTEYPGLANRVKRTCSFLYIRWIGQHGTYDRHTHERVDKSNQLYWWKEQINPHLEFVENVYGYFNNDYAGYAAGTCLKFKSILGLPDIQQTLTQGRLF